MISSTRATEYRATEFRAPHRRQHSRLPVVSAAALAALLSLLLGTVPAQAQASDNEAGAQQLFNQARALMKEKKYEQACARFEASQELDPAPGTVLNLAVCYQKLGRLATAWSHYRKAADMDQRAGNRKRAKFSRKAAARLEKRLPTLVITVTDDSVEGLKVTRNGETVAAKLFGEPVYVDPGEHRIVAGADGYESYSTEVEAEEGERSEVEIPALKARPDPEPEDDEPDLGQGTDTDTGKGGGSGRRTTGMVLGGVGVVSVGVGLGLGLSAKSTWDGAFDDGLCNRDTLECNAEGQSATDTARQRALMSNIAVGAGVALVATGLVLYLTAPDDREELSLAPVVGTEQWGMALSGHF